MTYTDISDEKGGRIHRASEGGLSGSHSSPDIYSILAAPSTSSQFNTVHLRLVPVACWRVEDVRFHFGSSFVTPEIETELKHLASLRKAHPGCPLAIFGHADPVGSDDYNKALSGRRAMTVYGLLTRDTLIWEHLYNQPYGGDNWRGVNATKTMQHLTGLPSGTSVQVLFRSYMDMLCGPDLQLGKDDFLARGMDPHGKGDYQGCGEFNPMLLFSEQEEREFGQAQDKSLRNTANAPNRRVMILIFRKGSRINPDRWPCPHAREGAEACRKRFWSDGEKRRNLHLAQDRREFTKTQDTFACRFYQRLVSGSPCESILKNFEIRLYDPYGRYIANAPCQVTIGNESPYDDQATDQGIIALRSVKTPSPCIIKWGLQPKEGEAPALQFTLNMLLVSGEPDTGEQNKTEEARKKLNNLGYCESDQTINVEGFQRDYGELASPALSLTGKLDDRTMELLRVVYHQCADDLRNSKPL